MPLQYINIVLLCPPALLVRTEAHARMRMAQRRTLHVCVRLDFLDTSARSPLTAASLTPASTLATAQTTAWPSHASVRTASPVSLVMTPAASRPAPAGPAPTRACVLVSLMEPSGAFAKSGLQVPHVPCSTGPKPGPSRSVPGRWTTECLP